MSNINRAFHFLVLLLTSTVAFAQNKPIIEGEKVIYHFTNYYSKNTQIKGSTDLWATAKGMAVYIVVIFDSKPSGDTIAMGVYDDNGDAIAVGSVGVGGSNGWKLSGGRWCQELMAFGIDVEDGKKYRVLINNGSEMLPAYFYEIYGKKKAKKAESNNINIEYPIYYYSGSIVVMNRRSKFTLSIQQTGNKPTPRYQGYLTYDGKAPIHLDGELEYDNDQGRTFIVLTSEYGEDAFRLLLDQGEDLSQYSVMQGIYSSSTNDYATVIQSIVKPSNYGQPSASGRNVGPEYIGIDEIKSYDKKKYIHGTSSWSAERVARAFCEAMYDNNMRKAKSYMTAEDAMRVPDSIRGYSEEELNTFKTNLKRAKYKVFESEYSSSFVTVRYYNPDYPYLDKRGRWFGCAIELFKTSDGWKVVSYGY